jgi:hypothetical protein
MCIVPTKPFVFDEAGNLFAEHLIFNNPDLLLGRVKKDLALSKHTDFLFKAGENLPTVSFCPLCGEERVRNVIWFDDKPRYELMSCNKEDCVSKLISSNPDGIACPIKVSTLNIFNGHPAQQREWGKFLRNILGLPRHVSPETVLGLFIDSYNNSLSSKELALAS